MTTPRSELWKGIIGDARSNVSAEVEQKLVSGLALMTKEGDFGDETMSKLKATELSLYDRPEDGKKQARVVFELVVQKGEPWRDGRN